MSTKFWNNSRQTISIIMVIAEVAMQTFFDMKKISLKIYIYSYRQFMIYDKTWL